MWSTQRHMHTIVLTRAQSRAMTRRPLAVPLEATRHLSDGPWGLALALDVIEADFGPFARLLADGMSALGRPSRAELAGWLARNCPSEHAPTLSKKVRKSLSTRFAGERHRCRRITTCLPLPPRSYSNADACWATCSSCPRLRVGKRAAHAVPRRQGSS